MKEINTNAAWKKEGAEESIVDSLYQYIKYWKWFVVSVLICLVLGVAFVLRSDAKYKTSLSILLRENSKSGSASSFSTDLAELGILSTTDNIDNEIAILTSPDLIKTVVESLELQTSYFTKNVFGKKNDIYDKTPFYARFESSKSDNRNDKIEFTIEQVNGKFSIEGVYNVVEGEKFSFSETLDKLPGYIDLPDEFGRIYLKRTESPVSDIKYYIEIEGILRTTNSIVSSLSVTPSSKYSSVLTIDFLTSNTFKGATVLNELIVRYNARNVQDNNQLAYNTALFINERLKEIENELGEVEENVVEYKQRNNITDLSSESKAFIEKTGVNEQKKADVETQLKIVSFVEDFIKNPNNHSKLIPNLQINDPGLVQTIMEYNEKTLLFNSLVSSTSEINPTRLRIQDELNNVRSEIINSIQNVKQAMSITRQDLTRQTETAYSRIRSVPQQERGLIEKMREQQIKENLFLFLMQKREETNIAMASSDKAKVIASPQFSTSPLVAPRTNIILLVAVILGVILPVLGVYFKNIFKTKISSREDLERLSEVRVIGQIDKNSTGNTICNDNSSTSELFRSLRNNVNFVLKSSDRKVLLVTSTIAHEGKTFISVNLAVSFALSKQKVLLIGADVRHPKISDALDVPKGKGLTDYLVDRDADWHDYLLKGKGDPNLDILLSGTIPPNPNELLMSNKLRELISEASKEYDWVILDSAPVGLISDSFLIAGAAEMTIYVVRENETPKDAISFINAQAEEGKLPRMYLVLNGSTENRNFKYGYGAKYGYQQ